MDGLRKPLRQHSRGDGLSSPSLAGRFIACETVVMPREPSTSDKMVTKTKRKRDMTIFQVSSRSVQMAAPPKKKPRRLHREWSAVIRFVLAVTSAGGLFALLAIFIHPDIKFLLLPVFVYLAATQFQRYNFKLPV